MDLFILSNDLEIIDLAKSFELTAESQEVYYTNTGVVCVGEGLVNFLKMASGKLPRQRCRICFHNGPNAAVHEMLIAHHRSCYVRPHRHLRNSESLTVIEGTANMLLFDDVGNIINNLRLEEAGNNDPFFCHIPSNKWHSLIIESEWLIFKEVAQGPFDPASSEFAPWSPPGNLRNDAPEYVDSLESLKPL